MCFEVILDHVDRKKTRTDDEQRFSKSITVNKRIIVQTN
jgi:hypothetical protein